MTSWGTQGRAHTARPGGQLGPLATKICFGGSVSLFLVCGFMAKGAFSSDDSGLAPPAALVAYNNAGGTKPGTKMPAHILSVRETYSPTLDENGKRTATIQTGPAPMAALAAPKTKMAKAKPPKLKAPKADIPDVSENKPESVKTAEVLTPKASTMTEPQNESRGVISIGARNSQPAAFEPIPFNPDIPSSSSSAAAPTAKTEPAKIPPSRKAVKSKAVASKPQTVTASKPEATVKTAAIEGPTTLPDAAPVPVPASGDPSMNGVIGFMKESAGDKDKTKIQQYIRTASVLKQCGGSQKKAKKAYEKANKRAYSRLIEFENRRISMANRSSESKAKTPEINENFADDFYPETPSSQTCETLGQQAKSGAFDIQL